MRKLVIVALAATVIPAVARADMSYNVNLLSDYVWRGISQTDRGIGIQGAAEYRNPSGFYANGLVSNVDIGGAHVRADAHLGVRFDAGLARWDTGFALYRFDKSALHFNEYYLGALLGDWSGKLSYDWDHKNWYGEFGYRHDLGSGLAFTAHAGRYTGPTINDYDDYSVGMSKRFTDVDVSLTYTNTDQRPRTKINDGRVVLGVTAYLQ